jgi:hypothetical protein
VTVPDRWGTLRTLLGVYLVPPGPIRHRCLVALAAARRLPYWASEFGSPHHEAWTFGWDLLLMHRAWVGQKRKWFLNRTDNNGMITLDENGKQI